MTMSRTSAPTIPAMSRERWRLVSIALAGLCLGLYAGPAGLSAAAVAPTPTEQVIAGDPLEIHVDNNMEVKVYRDEAGAFNRQYYAYYDTFLRLASDQGNGPVPVVYSANQSNVTPVSNTAPDASTIVTSVTTADAVTITQTVAYTTGQQTYRHTWVVSNGGSTTYTGVALRYGGDTYFANSDAASGFYDATQGMVYCTNSAAAGLMGMLGGLNSPATHYYEDGYSSVWSALAGAADLPDTVNSTFLDNGTALQWDVGTLAPGGSFTVVCIEKWTAAGLVQVIAPQQRAAGVGDVVGLDFSIQNLESVDDTFTFAVTFSAGLSGATPAPLLVRANSTGTVHIDVTVGPAAQDTVATVTLVATSTGTGSLVNQDSARLVIGTPVVTGVPPTPVTVPGIPLSRGNQTIYAALCPSTTAGVASLLGALAGRDRTQAVGYAWDAALQDYVQLPAQPGAGLLVSSGAFVAARVDLGLDFSGTASSLPFAISLAPGWNFIGIPPLDNGGSILATHAFPGDFELLDDAGALVTTASRFADILGTPGSGDAATAQPFSYDGAAYHQVGAMVTGRGYWLYNNTPTAAVTLRRTLTGATLLAASATRDAGRGKTGETVYTAHGAPPAPPAGAHADAGGHHCGLGSGVAGLAGFALSALFARLRRRGSAG
jgi:hypothetical protein